jgi:hypothetical protein
MRKTNLACLLARRVDGIMLNNFEGGEIGSDLFRHAYFSLGYIEKCVSLLVWEM